MARSRWKLTYFSTSIWRKIVKIKKNKKLRKRIIFDRSSSIPNCFTNRYFRIHKGRRSRSFFINRLVVGKKFGEFSFSRKPFYFPSKRSKKRNSVRR